MKKFLGLLAVLAVTAVISSSAFAVTYSTATYTAVASFVGSGTANFTFTLKNVNGNATANSIAWTSASAFVTGSTVQWVRADQYAVVAATVTKAGFNVYMYQDNKKSTTYKAYKPRDNYNGAVWTSSATSGLVRKGVTSTDNGNYRCYIPVAYSMVGAINNNLTYSVATATTSATRADRYFADVNDSVARTDYPGGIGSYTKIAALCGPVFGTGNEGDWTGSNVKNNTAYMYFFGGFANIIGGDEYGTDKLYVVQVTE